MPTVWWWPQETRFRNGGESFGVGETFKQQAWTGLTQKWSCNQQIYFGILIGSDWLIGVPPIYWTKLSLSIRRNIPCFNTANHSVSKMACSRNSHHFLYIYVDLTQKIGHVWFLLSIFGYGWNLRLKTHPPPERCNCAPLSGVSLTSWVVSSTKPADKIHDIEREMIEVKPGFRGTCFLC